MLWDRGNVDQQGRSATAALITATENGFIVRTVHITVDPRVAYAPVSRDSGRAKSADAGCVKTTVEIATLYLAVVPVRSGSSNHTATS